MDKNMFNSMIDFMLGGSERVPSFSLPAVDIGAYKRPIKENLRVTWFGHSTCLIEIDGKVIITDPMFSDRASPLSFIGPKRFTTDVDFQIQDLPKIDIVVISHDHYDHLDYDTIRYLRDKSEQFYVPLGVKQYLESWGVSPEKVVELDWWEENSYNGLRFAATPTRHFSGRGLRRDRTLWASWVIIGTKQRLYFGGDSGYFDGFKKIGEKYGPFDLTMLESGAYNNAWADIHMMPEETVQAHLDLDGEILLPIHWGKFNLSLHPWREPIERLLAEAKIKGVRAITPIQGEAIVLSEQYETETAQYVVNRWWDKSLGI
ncbi:MAG: MBL fold metallo-hydrolase [Desulfamplus sp.]|nr:MBL fold metallo-hydrolase [Desulfamplus sp.]